VLLPAVLLASGLIRAIWALRQREHISYRRAFLAFLNWLSLSLTVARACVEGLVRPAGTFLRTPKTGGVGHRIRATLLAARGETFLAFVLLALGVGLLGFSHASPLVVALVFWQGAVYWSGPVMSWMNQHAELTPELERRRRSEERRERLAVLAKGVQTGSLAIGGSAAVVFVLVLVFGASNPGHPRNPLVVPQTGPPAPAPSPSRAHHSPARSGASSSTTSSSTTSTTSAAGSTSSSTTTSSSSTTTTSSSSTTSTSTSTTTTTVASSG